MPNQKRFRLFDAVLAAVCIVLVVESAAGVSLESPENPRIDITVSSRPSPNRPRTRPSRS